MCSYTISNQNLNWQDLLQPSCSSSSLPTSVKCHHLCRLLFFGSSLLKSLSSQCLSLILHRITLQMKANHEELNCPTKYLNSMIAVLEGLVFYEDRTVALNCGICLSEILIAGENAAASGNHKWLRLIMEEFAMTLTAPAMASKWFKNQHKSAAHVAAGLLRLDGEFEWMRSVFDVSCVSGIVGGLCARNLSPEIVEFFRALLSARCLNEDQVGCLNQVFQIFRKQVYKEGSKSNSHESSPHKFISSNGDLGKICNLILHLLLPLVFKEEETEQDRLLNGIDLFYQELSTHDRSDAS